MTKAIAVFFAPLVVVALAGASQAQLFIEDFDTYTAWSGGDGTQLTSKDGETTNGWVKGAIHNTRRSAAYIGATGINGTQGARRSVKAAEVSGAARDITGEINPNGNYMVRVQSHVDPGWGTNPRGVQLLIGDANTFERFANGNEIFTYLRMLAPGLNMFNHYTLRRGAGATAAGGDNDEFADYFCEWENPDDPPYRLVPLEAGTPFCLVDFLDDPSVDYQYSSLFDFNPFGEWMELMMNANMNNGVATAWYRDVDDTTGEPTSAWSKLPWNFGRGSGSTVFGLPFTSLEAAGFFVWGSSGGMVDNFISGHPLLANQGDFDGDGDIDGNDFLIWQNNFPRTDGAAISFIGDATGDGNVDGDDFLVWQNSFPYPAVLSKTPEPASLGLVALGGLLMLRRRRSMKTTPTFHESSRPCPRRKHS